MAQQTFEELVDAVKQAESRGKRYKDDGKTLTTSSKGALGEMQVMPKTIRDPGFGVVPARDKSPDEIARVGVDYLQAMKQKYGDTEKALIAYNWGPGSTDKWLASGADPKKLPAETRTYVERVKGFLGKDVPRETMAKKEREPLPASLPPMAQADIKSNVKPEAAARVASLGPGYQAALALSFLAETDDEEDRKTTITQEYLAKAQEDEDDRAASAAARTRQANVFADLSNTTIRSPFAEPQQPVRMAEGGEAKSLLSSFVKRAEGSPKEGERKLDRETMDMLRRQGTSPASLQRVAPPADISSSAAGLPGLMLLADPRIDNTNAYGYVLDSSDDKKNFGMAQAMFLNKSRSEDYPDTIAHETEHLLARQNLGSAASINSKFDELIGNKGTSRLNFVRDAVKAAPYLKEKYDLQSSYLDPKMFEYQTKFGLGKNLLYEQLASLAALEQRHKVDLTKDPELRKTLFSRPDVRETYNALTGLRQTRLDPRDLPPHTRVPEPGMLDAIKGVFKRAEGGPVYRADGSPEEGEVAPRLTMQQIEALAAREAAEREALSTPAFIAQKSGIGRKAGPVSQALQSGDAYIAAAKGVTEMPYNLAGAPMDLAMLTRQALTGQAPAGQVGTSEYIKKMATEMGIRPAPPTDPTLRGFYDIADIGSSALNPASIPRAAARGASAVAEKAGDAARDFQQYNQQLGVPNASYAVRNKGTLVPMSGFFGLPTQDQATIVVNNVINDVKQLHTLDKPLTNWFQKTVTRYLRSDFASPDDQLVKAAEKGQLLHLAPKDFSDSASDQLLKKFLERRQSDLEYMRQAEGFGNTNMATQPYGQRIEDLTDISAYPERVGDLTPNRVPPSMRNIVETRPETRVTDFAPGIVDNLKLNELRDKMLDVRQSGGKYGAYGQPEVKIPAEYLLPDSILVQQNVAAASNRMAKYTNWQDDTRQRMATTSLREDPRFTRAPLQEGKYLGVALPDVRQNPEVKQLVLDVGCDGGWCTRYSQNAKSYGSGDSRLHIMVTGEGKKARPVAQFAIADSGPAYDAGSRFSIREIKEKGNTTDFKNNPALPAIQEYVKFLDKSYGGLFHVDELKGLNMVNMRDSIDFSDYGVSRKNLSKEQFGAYTDLFHKKLVELNDNSYFIDKDKLPDLVKRVRETIPTNAARQIQMNLFQPPKEKATGGMMERQPDDNRRYL